MISVTVFKSSLPQLNVDRVRKLSKVVSALLTTLNCEGRGGGGGGGGGLNLQYWLGRSQGFCPRLYCARAVSNNARKTFEITSFDNVTRLPVG